MKQGAPLDEPERMGAWRMVTKRQPLPGFMAEDDVSEDEIDTEDDTDVDDLTNVQMGARAQITALEIACAKAEKRYNASVNNPIQGPLRFKEWIACIEALRKLSKDTPKTETSDAKSISIEAVETALVRNLSEIKNQIELIAQKVRKNCEHIDPEIMIEVEEVIHREVAHTIKAMRQAQWIPA
jgi:hypothetical protein